jgi:N-acetylmuramoyl-L-alanine amidase
MKKVFKITILAVMVLFMGLLATYTTYTKPTQTAYAVVYQQGSSGSVIKTIQTKLKNWGYYKGSIDGIFGSQTKQAVRYFQQKNGLKVDGIVGNQTLKALGMKTTNNQTQSSTYTDADINLLARLIYGEARGESYVGQVAVGAVVLNRIKSASFPNTMAGVIYQSYAFTAVDDGQINLQPNATARKAALDAINGWDPSYGALYYYNPATATSSWIFTRKTTVTIGNHVFAI